MNASAYPTEEDLVLQAVGGSRSAFESLVRMTARATYAGLVVKVRDRGLAEDLCQETYLRAWRKVGTLEDAGRFRPWLGAIARSVLLDHLKSAGRAKRGGAPAELGEVGSDGVQGVDVLAGREEAEAAVVALEGLPEPYRTALTLRYLAESPREDISRQMGVSGGAVRGMLARGMTLLRERLGVRGEKQETSAGGDHA